MPLSKMREFGIKSESLVGPHKLKVEEKEGIRQMVEALDHVPSPDVGPNLILYGPPGTGKTYHAAIYADALVGTAADGGKEEFENALSFWKQKDYGEVLDVFHGLKEEGCIATTTFHQSFGYEDFIEGIKPRTEDGKVVYEVEPGLFKRACHEARLVSDYPYVFVIDEINRGNISKIFGELITLIEKSKRGGAEEAMSVTLPYSGETFSVPKNLYIIGTMNTADRSIALMDTALRRRFHFVEMMPDVSLLKDVVVEENGVKVNVGEMLETINRRIEVLYDREHTIGHAYFMKLRQNPSLSVLADIFKENIIPLLQEYFYDDYSRIQLVLGDNSKSKADYQFIKNIPLKAKQLFKGNVDLDLPEQEYQLQDTAFTHIESYAEIMNS